MASGAGPSTTRMAELETALENVLAFESNRDNLEDLVSHVRQPGVIPFIGAGVSVSFGMPSWTDFLLQQAKRAGEETAAEVLEAIQRGEYEKAAEALESSLGPNQLKINIRSRFASLRKPSEEFPAAAFLPKLCPRGPVITTNYDDVVPTAFEQASSGFKEILPGSAIDRIVEAVRDGSRVLVKLHGDYENQHERVLTLKEYQKYYGDPEQLNFDRGLAKLMRFLSNNKYLLFVGCSLAQDRTMQVLKAVFESDINVKHFAIVEQPRSTRDLAAKRRFLGERGILPIWFPEGEFHFVPLLLEFVAREAGEPPAASDSQRVDIPEPPIANVVPARSGELGSIVFRRSLEVWLQGLLPIGIAIFVGALDPERWKHDPFYLSLKPPIVIAGAYAAQRAVVENIPPMKAATSLTVFGTFFRLLITPGVAFSSALGIGSGDYQGLTYVVISWLSLYLCLFPILMIQEAMIVLYQHIRQTALPLFSRLRKEIK